MRTPINAAAIGAKLLTDEASKRADPTENDSIDTLKCIVTACEAAIDVLNDILCFDKIESRTIDLRTQSTAIIPFLSDCLKIFAPIALEKHIELRQSFEHGNGDLNIPSLNGSTRAITDDDFIEIDIFKIRQVLRNMLSNALKFTPSNGQIVFRAWITNEEDNIFSPLARKKILQRSLTADVDIELGELIKVSESSTLTIMIKDTGAGFDEVHRDKVFKEVFQFKPEVLQGGGGR